MEAATAAEAEAAKTSMAETSSAVVAATAVAGTVTAAVVAAVQSGELFLPLPWRRFPQAHRTSPFEYPCLLDVAAASEAAVLQGADLHSWFPLRMLRIGCYSGPNQPTTLLVSTD